MINVMPSPFAEQLNRLNQDALYRRFYRKRMTKKAKNSRFGLLF